MNERIRELALQAGVKLDYFGYGVDIDGGNPNISKFAELLAQDAISIVQSFRCKFDASNDNIVEALKHRFGIKMVNKPTPPKGTHDYV